MAKPVASIAICDEYTMLPIDSFTQPQYLNNSPTLGEYEYVGIKPDGYPVYDPLVDGNYKISPSTWTSLGSQTLTITYTGSSYIVHPVYYTVNVVSPEPAKKIIINAELYEEVEKTLVSISGPSTTSTYHSGDITFIYSDGSTQSYAYSISRKHVLTTDAPGTFTYNRDEYEPARLFLVLYDWTDGDMTITDISLARDDGSYFN